MDRLKEEQSDNSKSAQELITSARGNGGGENKPPINVVNDEKETEHENGKGKSSNESSVNGKGEKASNNNVNSELGNDKNGGEKSMHWAVLLCAAAPFAIPLYFWAIIYVLRIKKPFCDYSRGRVKNIANMIVFPISVPAYTIGKINDIIVKIKEKPKESVVNMEEVDGDSNKELSWETPIKENELEKNEPNLDNQKVLPQEEKINNKNAEINQPQK